jgi:hypothetical protein
MKRTEGVKNAYVTESLGVRELNGNCGMLGKR